MFEKMEAFISILRHSEEQLQRYLLQFCNGFSTSEFKTDKHSSNIGKRLFFLVEKCRFGFLRRSHKKGKVRCFATSNFLHAKFVFLIKSCPNPAKERMEERRKLNLAR